MRLTTYLETPGRTASALAVKCGCAVSTITRVANGTLTPSVRLIKRIVEHTDGEVTSDDIIEVAA